MEKSKMVEAPRMKTVGFVVLTLTYLRQAAPPPPAGAAANHPPCALHPVTDAPASSPACSLNSSLNLLNKWSLGVYGFRFPFLLTSCAWAGGSARRQAGTGRSGAAAWASQSEGWMLDAAQQFSWRTSCRDAGLYYEAPTPRSSACLVRSAAAPSTVALLTPHPTGHVPCRPHAV
mgnify:CR=1 FL=1